MKIETNQQYQQLRHWLQDIPYMFQSKQGKLLYTGRNEVRLFQVGDDKRFVVKRFKRHGFLKCILYSFFRKNKALRAYENAGQLCERGFYTPSAVAYIEESFWGVIWQVYYVSAYTEALPIRLRLIETTPFDHSLAVAYAHFVAQLHEAGVLHCDLNPTNVLYIENDGQFHFELIDINRMHFYDGPVPKAVCMENLTLFWWLSPVYRFVLNKYAIVRNWTKEDKEEAVRIKKKHDKMWVCRKRLTHPFSYRK